MRKKMLKIAALGVIISMTCFLWVGHAASETIDGTTIAAKERTGVSDPVGGKGGAAAGGASAKGFVKRGVPADWHFARYDKGAAFPSVGPEEFVSDRPMHSVSDDNALNNPNDLGYFLRLKKNVRFKAGGRYKRVGRYDRSTGLGGDFGLKVSF